MALDRNSEYKQIGQLLVSAQGPIAASAEIIYEGAMVMASAGGYLIKVGDSGIAGVGPVLGTARFKVDNSAGAAGDKSLDLFHGLQARPNSSTTPVTWDSFGRPVYAEDDELISSDPALPVAGTMWGFTEDGLVIFEIAGNVASQAAKSASLPLSAAGFYELDGTPLAAFADGASPTPGLSLNDSEGAGVRWNNDAAPDGIVTSFPVPPDLDETQVAYLLITAAKVGATPADVPTFGVEIYEQLVGATYDAGSDLGGSTNAMGDEPTKTVQVLALEIPADTLSAPATGSMLTVTLTPEAGKLGTDDLIMFGATLRYARRL
jgi:hypothetical protein